MQIESQKQTDFHMRFGGIERLLTPTSFEVLQQSHILIVGIGGVGSWCAESVARTGIGKITLLDLDDVCITNTNRQLNALNSTIGKSKVEVMRERISDIAPECQVQTICDFFDDSTADSILEKKYDIIIDCIDSLQSKCLLINSCKTRNIPLITVGGAGGKIDPLLIRTSDLNHTSNDTLLKQVRRSLKLDWGWDKSESKNWGIQAVYSIERSKFLDSNGSLQFVPDLKMNRGISCTDGIGTTSWITGTFGFMAASLAVQTLVKRAD